MPGKGIKGPWRGLIRYTPAHFMRAAYQGEEGETILGEHPLDDGK
jgi:hypothetical protein